MLIATLLLWSAAFPQDLPTKPPQVPTPAPPVLSGSWTATEVAGKPVDREHAPTMQFQDGSRVSGNTGCNSYSGDYVLEGANLKFSPAAMTRRACLGEGTPVELAFTKALTGTATYRLEEKKLTLLDASGTVLAAFSSN